MKESTERASIERNSSPKMSTELRLFQVSALCIAFLLGGVLAAKDMQPFRYIFKAYDDLVLLGTEVSQTRHRLVLQKTHSEEGVTVYQPSLSYGGYTVVQGTFDEGVQARLLDMQGNIVHKWTIDYFDIWPDPPAYLHESSVPITHFDYHSQGFSLLRDGSIVLSLGNLGTVKLDKCSNPVWTVDRATHHVVTAATDGGFWIAGNRNIDDIDSSLMKFGVNRASLETTLGRYENLLIRVDHEGKVQRELSVLAGLFKGQYLNQLFDSMQIKSSDPTHINDIELVTPNLAAKIPGVEPGDLLVSIRQMHTLAIFDVHSGDILWTFRGPWIRQHDPDILPNGNIIVLDNGSLEFAFSPVGGSSLVELDPATGAVSLAYPTEKRQRFYTDIMGSHQQLPNGNRLITESRAGRVFEISPNGETVWELVQAYDETHAALIEIAERVDSDFFDVDDWNCH